MFLTFVGKRLFLPPTRHKRGKKENAPRGFFTLCQALLDTPSIYPLVLPDLERRRYHSVPAIHPICDGACRVKPLSLAHYSAVSAIICQNCLLFTLQGPYRWWHETCYLRSLNMAKSQPSSHPQTIVGTLMQRLKSKPAAGFHSGQSHRCETCRRLHDCRDAPAGRLPISFFI
jgi:hypothetical protein